MFSFKFFNLNSVSGIAKFTFVALFSLTLVSCDLAANYTKTDRGSNMEFQDFRDGLADRLPEVENDDVKMSAKSSIPALQPYVSLSSDSMKSMPLVSVSVNQTVPIKDILYELAEQAGYDIELDPNIRGSIIFTARNKPFDVVIERISKMAGLRHSFEGDFLRVELDNPYIKTYKIDYLSFIRTNSGSVSTSVSVVSGEGADAGSAYSASSESQSDFWGELELNLEQILGGASTGALKTKRDPKISAVSKNPEVAAVSPQKDGDNINVAPPEVVLNIESLPIDDMDDDEKEEAELTYSLNKQAGLVNIYATQKVHKEVEHYLNVLRRSVTSQVLVEAKIFEVTLNDEYINGIEWGALAENGKGSAFFAQGADFLVDHTLNLPGGVVSTATNFGIGYTGSDVGAFIKAISGFGTVRALASPRLTVLNNQSAVLNVATNRVFFEIDLNRETDDDTGDVTLEVETEIKSVPEGVLINVQPSINLENRTISMSVRPSITRIVGTKSDPGVLFVSGATGITSDIPEVNIQEIDTVVKVDSGQAIVMGGLLQDRSTTTEEKVPVVGELPVIGNLFRKHNDLVQKTELVIFLKATIVDSAGDTIHNTDRDLYRTFSGDRRPLDL